MAIALCEVDHGGGSPCEKALVAAPHKGMFALDVLPDGRTCLTNTVTRERVQLGPGGWELRFGEDELFCMVASAAGEDIVDPDQRPGFKHQVFIANDSGEY